MKLSPDRRTMNSCICTFVNSFCCLQISSPDICLAFQSLHLSQYIGGIDYVRTILCFLKPQGMIIKNESPNHITEQLVYEEVDGEILEISREVPQSDPVHELFNPKDPKSIGKHYTR